MPPTMRSKMRESCCGSIGEWSGSVGSGSTEARPEGAEPRGRSGSGKPARRETQGVVILTMGRSARTSALSLR